MKKILSRAQVYWTVWWKMAQYAWAETFLNRGTSFLFIFGKALRFIMALFFLLLLQQNLNGIGDYTTDQIVIFFLTYQFLDTVSQIIFRGVYIFGWQVRSGELDFYLSKPISPLFRILTGKPDILDAFFLIPSTALSIWIALHLNIHVTLLGLLMYFCLLINGFFILMSLHILVVCLGIVTTEVDNAIMLYRDINNLARFPVDIYREPLRTMLYFLVPVGIINTVPTQILLGIPSFLSFFAVFGFGIGFFLISIGVWKLSVKKYSSAGG
jgi:ABC-2 type transport system permease protein